jgi:hypothetical protein
MVAQMWSQFEMGSSAYIVLRAADWSSVPIVGRVVRVDKHGSAYLTAFHFDRLLSDLELSSYLGPS